MKRSSPREKYNKRKPGVMPTAVEAVDSLAGWVPKTSIGKKVLSGEVSDIDYLFDNGYRILEAEIVDKLLNLEVILMEVGQSKGKFGGGKGSIWKQTQKKTKEGNRIKFSTFALVGNKDGYVGVGFAGAKETVPARQKAIRSAKLNLIRIRRGCGSWSCGCKDPHSVPYKVEGKVGSSKIVIMPAPKGSGLVIEERCGKILEFAGIKDVYSKSYGQTNTKLNFMLACYDALKNLTKVKIKGDDVIKYGLVEGKK